MTGFGYQDTKRFFNKSCGVNERDDASSSLRVFLDPFSLHMARRSAVFMMIKHNIYVNLKRVQQQTQFNLKLKWDYIEVLNLRTVPDSDILKNSIIVKQLVIIARKTEV